MTESDDSDVASATPNIDAVDVDVCQGSIEWINRMSPVILCPKQAFLFRGHREKEHRPLWGNFTESFGKLEQRCGAGGVIDGAIVDLITLQFRIASKVIPMRAVDDVFVLELRI